MMSDSMIPLIPLKKYKSRATPSILTNQNTHTKKL